MNCVECQSILGANPAADDAEVLSHIAVCDICASFQKDFLAFDARLKGALNIEVPSSVMAMDYQSVFERESLDFEARLKDALNIEVPSNLMDIDYDSVESEQDKVVAFPGAKRRQPSVFRPLALAASVLMVVGASFFAWQGALQTNDLSDTWGVEVVAHISHEPASMDITNPVVPRGQIQYISQRTGVSIDETLGEITYIRACPFRGKLVTHLVTKTSNGPVTIMLLPGETVEEIGSIEKDGYVGTVLPVDGGSIIVVGENEPSAAEAAKRVVESVSWDI